MSLFQEVVWNTEACRHKNIMHYWASFVDAEERLWIVAEPTRIGSVKRLLQEHCAEGIQNEVLVATILRYVLRAVQYLHNNSFIHKYAIVYNFRH